MDNQKKGVKELDKHPSTFTLKSSDLKKLKDIFNNYAKDNTMKFYEFFHFCLDKELVTNKSNFSVFLKAFYQVSEGDDKMDLKFFPNLMTVVARFLIPGKKRPILDLLNKILGDQTVSINDRSECDVNRVVQKPRTIQNDDTNRRLLYTNMVKVYLKYEDYLKGAFTSYFQANYPKKRMVFLR